MLEGLLLCTPTVPPGVAGCYEFVELFQDLPLFCGLLCFVTTGLSYR